MSNIYNLTDTWNAAGTTFTAIKMNVTDTASAAGSRLIDLQVAGSSRLYLDKSGALVVSGPVTASSLTLSSALALSSGGTGATTAAGARVSILPALATNGGKVLAVNAGATDVEWITLAGGGSVTSVNAAGGSTGLTFSGGPITSSGTLTLGGVLALASGGTGAITPAAARVNLLPSYSGNGSRVLALNAGGTDVEWVAISTNPVASVSGTAPIVSSGGITPTISITAATTSAAGSMSAADKTKLDGIAAGATANTGTVTGVTGTAPIVSSGGTAPAISISAATTSAAGSMSAADKSKLDGIAAGATANAGTVTGVTGTAPIVSSGGTAPAISISAATTSAAGSMSAADKTKLDGISTGATANSGTVTSVSVVSANGFAGTVATPTTTPAITLSTSISGLLKGNGTAISAAVAGTDYVIPSGSITGNAGTATTLQTARLINGVSFNGSANITITDGSTRFQSASDFVDGTLVTTDIPANVVNGNSFIIEITGKSYSSSVPPFKAIAQGYLYNDTIISFSGINYGGAFSSYIKVFEEGGVLKFWWPRISYWNSFNVNVMSMDSATNGNTTRNRVTAIANSLEPTGTKKVQINLATTWNSTNFTPSTYLPLVGGTMTGAITFAAGQTWPTFNQNTTGTASNITGTYSGSISSSQITTGLGFTPYNATNPSGYITSSGSITGSAATLTTARTLTIGSTGKTFNGSANVSWNHAELGTVRNFGAVAVQGVAGSNQTCTTAEFITWLTNLGAFAQTASVMKCTWDYAGNNDISDTGFGQLDMAGCIIETFTDGSQYIVRVTSPSTGSGAGGIHEYINHGPSYSPGWRRVYTSALNGNITGTASNITGTYGGTLTSSQITTGLGFTPYNATNPNGYTSNTGTVTGVTGTAPIVSSGGTAPAISISAATTSAAGSMSAADKTKLDGIAAGATANAGTVTGVTGTAPIVSSGGTAPAISISAATTSAAGSMSAADKTKLDGIATGATANSGTVTSVSVVSANGFAGSVATNTTTPAITISTSISGLLKGNGTAISQAVAGTDYVIPSGSITGSAGSLSSNASYMVSRGTVAQANVDTATLNGFYTQSNTSDSQGILVFNPGGSLGPLQMTFTYTGLMQFRNRTDSATWTAWKTVLTSANFNSYSPTLTGGGASGSWGINITGSAASITGTYGGTLTSSQITTGLGFTPYNATNPNGYITSSGSISGNAGTVGGLAVHAGTNNEANKIVRTDANGYIIAGYLNSANGNEANNSNPPRVWGTNGSDSYLRTYLTSALQVGYATSAGFVTTPTFSGDSVDKDNITTRTDTGFYQSSTGTVAEGWPTDSNGWHHLISSTHNNDSNYYALQISSRFDTQNLYFRNTNGSGTTAWSTLLHSGNYNDYAPTKTGGGASGTWGINVTGTAGSISGFNNPTTGATANTIVYRDGSGDDFRRYGFAEYFNMSHGASGATTDTIFYSSGDNYIRKNNATGFRASLNVPTRTGGDASGTWGINVTGSSASAPTLSALGNYAWSQSTLPTTYPMGVQASFVGPGGTEGSWQNYGSVMTMRTYAGGGGSLQLYVPYGPANGGTGLQVRFGNYSVSDGNSWTSWKTLLASDNFNSYSPTLTGGGASGTWSINVTGNAATVTNGLYTSGDQGTITGTKRFYSPNNTQVNTVSPGDRGLGIFQETTNADAYMTFHISNDYAAYFGLGGAENDLVYGGWSAGANRYRILHTGNYTSWVPSTTGTGASGTWGINISGTAATATSADQIDGVGFRNTGSNASTNADTIESNGITYYGAGVSNFTGNATDGALYSQAYSANWQHQIAGDYRSGQIALRGKNNGTWQSWRTVLDSSNYSSYAVPLSGGTMSGQLNGTVGSFSGAVYASNWFRSYGQTGWYNETYGGGVWMEDATWVRVYNSKAFYVANEIAATGNITAYYSDERLKTKTGSLDNAVAKIQSLNGFTYVENDLARELGYKNNKQQVGVSAQEVQAVLPEAVSLAPADYETLEDGSIVSKTGENYLTVDYSRLVPLLIEAVKEQQAQIDELKNMLAKALGE
jgi:hypothetical protein